MHSQRWLGFIGVALLIGAVLWSHSYATATPTGPLHLYMPQIGRAEMSLSDYTGLLYSQSVPYTEGLDAEIYTVRGDGTALTMLTDNEWVDTAPAWSPDGSFILWQQYDDSAPSAPYNDLWLMNTDGTNARNLTLMTGRETGKWSPTTNVIAFQSYNTDLPYSEAFDFYITTPTATKPTLIMGETELDEFEWSPTGSQLHFTIRRVDNEVAVSDLYVVNADGAGMTLLASGIHRNATWSPDGAWLGYEKETAGNLDIYITRADGSETRQLTHRSEDEGFRGWVEMGAKALVARLDDNGNVTATDLVTIADSIPAPFLTEGGYILTISPDGTQVVYGSSYDSGILYLQATKSLTPTQISPEFASCFMEICRFRMAWAADGNHLVYSYSRSQTSQTTHTLYLVEVAGTESNYELLEAGGVAPQWLPGSSTRFAATADTDIGRTIKLFNVRTDETVFLPRPGESILIQSEWRYDGN